MSLTLTPSPAAAPSRRIAPVQSLPKRYLDRPSPWNPTVVLFLGGYFLAALTIYGWFVAGWPLPARLALGYTAGWSQPPPLGEPHPLIHHWSELTVRPLG